MTRVPFYFDFVSPYTWLALMRAPAFAEKHGVDWEMRPVVYAKLLESHGLLGPAEVPAKRRYTFLDIQRLAAPQGVRLSGPPAHPFRSLEALRVAVLFRREPAALELCRSIANACWGEGLDLSDVGVLGDRVERAGLDATGLPDRIGAQETKQELVGLTAGALEQGVFGVPTFALDGELFWGHDRMDLLAARLAGQPRPAPGEVERLLARPAAVRRKQVRRP